MRDLDTPTDPLLHAFDQLTRAQVFEALRLIEAHDEDWLLKTAGRRAAVSRYLTVAGRRYPLKATGYLAAQLAAGLPRPEGNPVKVDRVVRALCRCGFDVTWHTGCDVPKTTCARSQRTQPARRQGRKHLRPCLLQRPPQ